MNFFFKSVKLLGFEKCNAFAKHVNGVHAEFFICVDNTRVIAEGSSEQIKNEK